jgi:glycosyltransferase involved in cell wall biosynthesis
MNILMTLANPFTHDPRVYNEAKSLVDAGHSVTVLAWDNKKEQQHEEIKDGINIVRSYNTKFMDLLPYDIFRLHFWWRKGYKDALNLCEKNSFDVVHSHDLSSLPIGIKLKKKLNLPLIYDAHEIWGYMITKDLPKWWANWYLSKEKKLVQHPTRIITVNELLRRYFRGITNKPIAIVMNCKHLQERKYEPAKNDEFTLLYIGTLSKSRFLLEIIDVVKEILGVCFVIAGSGKPGYVKALQDKRLKIQNIDFIGRIPMKDVLSLTKKSNVVICLFDPNDKNNQVGLPNKVFEAAVCGRPMIVTEGLYYEKLVVEKEKFGLGVQNTRESIRDVIITLKNNHMLCEKLGKNGLKAAMREYNWERQEEKLLKVYEGLA